MDIEQIKKEVLEYLFGQYLEQHGTAICDISALITKHGKKPEEVGRYLVKNGWVKNVRSKGGVLEASIDIAGIRETNPKYLSINFNRTIASLGPLDGGRMSLLKILGLDKKDAQLAFDLGRYLSGTGYVHAKFSKDDVSIMLSPLGIEFYTNNKASIHSGLS